VLGASKDERRVSEKESRVRQRLEDEGVPLKEDSRPLWRVSRLHFRPVAFERCTLGLPAVALGMQELVLVYQESQLADHRELADRPCKFNTFCRPKPRVEFKPCPIGLCHACNMHLPVARATVEQKRRTLTPRRQTRPRAPIDVLPTKGTVDHTSTHPSVPLRALVRFGWLP
jgi:hypothetical protein